MWLNLRFFKLFVCYWLIAVAPVEAGISVSDNHGRVIDIAQPVQRIVALAPHITENLFAIGAGSLVVGVTRHSDYPPEAANLAIVGDAQGFNLEAIIKLQPDLIVAWPAGNPRLPLQRLEQMGIPVYYSDPHEFKDIPSNLRALGKLTGLSLAEEQASVFEKRLQDLRQRFSQRKKLRVFYQLWNQPLMTINHTQLIDRVINLCGGDNLFAEHKEVIPRLGVESVLLTDPQVIFTGEDMSEGWEQPWLNWPTLAASRYGQFYRLNEDLLYRPTMRILDGAEQMCKLLQRTREIIAK